MHTNDKLWIMCSINNKFILLMLFSKDWCIFICKKPCSISSCHNYPETLEPASMSLSAIAGFLELFKCFFVAVALFCFTQGVVLEGFYN